MSTINVDGRNRETLRAIARRVMIERGLVPDFSPEALAELERLGDGPPANHDPSVRDLRDLIWCSIDNDDSRDLDQLTVAEPLEGDAVKMRIAIADVDSLVAKECAIDAHAQQNTTSVYTVAEIFPMLPEKLSTDLTSLNHDSDRHAIVIEMTLDSEGSITDSNIYRALVRNHAKLAYDSTALWLDGRGEMPEPIGRVGGLADNIRLQDRVAQRLKSLRHQHGALNLETIESRPVFVGDELRDLAMDRQNRAKELIADLMIAANGVAARFLAAKKFPALRRVVKTPKRWERIVEIAAEHGAQLPGEPDPKALENFLLKARQADPLHFPDLSLSIIKLLGPGEYVAQMPEGDNAHFDGHFGLAVKDYAHSTAPNRRYPDLITQRLLKAAIAGAPIPYDLDELDELARHCTREEDAAKKVERQVGKCAAAMLLESRVGEKFDAIVTGAAEKGTWVRILQPPVEGRLEIGREGVDVGQKIRVQLLSTNVQRGFIDFKRIR